MKTLMAYLVSVIAGYVLATVLVSWTNIQAIVDLGFEITLSQRGDTIIHDLVSMTATYLPLMAIALLIGFLVAGLIIRMKPSLAFVGYVLAGFVAVVVLHVAMKAALGLTGIAAVRGMMGLIVQGLAGAFAGWCFFRLKVGGPETSEPAESSV
jgi:hypothetical protein